MDYSEHYRRLIERSFGRIPDGYSERHHVEPRCLGGDDEEDNIVDLTAEEHYLAHELLVKMNPGHVGLGASLMWMTASNDKQPRRNKVCGWARRAFAAALSDARKGKPLSEATRAAALARHKGSKHTPEHNAKIAAAHRGKKHTDEYKAAMSAARKGKPLSQATRDAALAYHKGRKHTPEHNAKIAAANTGQKRTPEQCARIADSLKGKKKAPFSEAHLAAMSRGSKAAWERRKQATPSQ